MTARKRTKDSRLRGSHTHGYGSKKKHRGKGHRGGRGMAGTGKRSDCKRPMIWKDPKYFGRYGFKPCGAFEEIRAVNIKYFEEKLNTLLSQKIIEQKGTVYVIDVEKLGFNKVLGCGKLTKKFKVIAPYFSEGAIERIQAAGGEIVKTRKAEEIEKTLEKATKQEES
jgi:large subunit ribosomal protein L15